MLNEEQIENIKSQLIAQIDSSFPENKKQEAIEKVKNMGEKELEDFLEKNKLIKKEEEIPCVFCAIISKKISSYEIGENKIAIAVLEINPISKGHTLIIPKKHIKKPEEMPNQAHSLAKKISKKIKSKLKSKENKIFFSNFMGHEIINILPVYNEEKENSPRLKTSKEELKKLQEILKEKKSAEKIKKTPKNQKKEIIENPNGKIWLPRRIP